jgi:hypothetical protein
MLWRRFCLYIHHPTTLHKRPNLLALSHEGSANPAFGKLFAYDMVVRTKQIPHYILLYTHFS